MIASRGPSSSRTSAPPRSPRALALASWLCVLLALAACPLGGSSDLIEDSNAQVIVTGLAGDEVVRLAIAGQRKEARPFGAEPLVLYLTLAPGEHEGTVEIDSPAEAPRCAPVRLSLESADDRDVASVDARTAPLCDEEERDGGPEDAGADAGPSDAGGFDAGGFDAGGLDAGPDDGGSDAGPDDGGFDAGPDDGGFDAGPNDGGFDAGPGDGGPGEPVRVFVHLEETVTVSPCLSLLCDIVTRVTADGTLLYIELDLPLESGTVSDGDVDALAADTLSPAADLLFAGQDPTCPQPRPAGLEEVHLERSFVVVEGNMMQTVTEDIDVSGCTEGIAWTLRQRLSLLRAVVLGL